MKKEDLNYFYKYSQKFAGEFIDSEGNLNIGIVGKHEETIKSIKKVIRDKEIKFYDAKFSLKYLEEIMRILNKNISILDIHQIEISEKNNKIYVYLIDLDKDTINRIKKTINSSAIEFKKFELTIKFE